MLHIMTAWRRRRRHAVVPAQRRGHWHARMSVMSITPISASGLSSRSREKAARHRGRLIPRSACRQPGRKRSRLFRPECDPGAGKGEESSRVQPMHSPGAGLEPPRGLYWVPSTTGPRTLLVIMRGLFWDADLWKLKRINPLARVIPRTLLVTVQVQKTK